MSVEIEQRLNKIPVINGIVRLLKSVRFSALEGLSLYDIMEMYIIGIIQGTLSSRASSIAFSLFLALFPLLIFLITMIPFVIPFLSIGNENFDEQFLLFLESFLPSATSDYFGDIYHQIKGQKRGGLLSSTFVLSIFLMANGVNAIFEGFETSYHIKLTRNFFKQYIYALMVGLILSILLIVGAVAYVYFDLYILEYLSVWAAKTRGYDLTENHILGARIGKFVFFTVLSYFTTATLYYFGTREGKQAKFFSYGALMTTLLFQHTLQKDRM